jgi:hypothetical protein
MGVQNREVSSPTVRGMLFRGHDAVAAILASLVGLLVVKLIELFLPDLPPSLAPYIVLTAGPFLRVFSMLRIERKTVPPDLKWMVWVALIASVIGAFIATRGIRFLFVPGQVLKGWMIFCTGLSLSIYFSLPLMRPERKPTEE